jgi:DNA-binding LytR/AlgR family response regulator
MKNVYLQLNSRDEFHKIDISKIVYFEAEGNYTNIVTTNKLKCVASMNLSGMQKMLSDSLKEKASIFIRIGKKHIINHNYIYRISIAKQQLVLSDCERFAFALSVSKEALKKLKDILCMQKLPQSK